MLLIALFGYSCHLYYNPVGYLASLQGRNYATFIETRLDALIPFSPVWVHFYQLAYFAPLVVLLAVMVTRKADLGLVRRALVAFVGLIFSQYVLYLTFPVSALALRVSELGTGWHDRLVAYQYFIATPWNAWPSLHVSACWFFFRLTALYFRRARWIYLAWFTGMLVGTVAIRIHFVLDGLTGLLLGELAYRLFARLTAQNSLSGRWSSPWRLALVYTAAITLSVTGLILLVAFAGYEGPLYVMTGRRP